MQANLYANLVQCIILVGVAYLIYHQHKRQRAAIQTAAEAATQMTAVLALMRSVSERQLQWMERWPGAVSPPAAPAAPPLVDVSPRQTRQFHEIRGGEGWPGMSISVVAWGVWGLVALLLALFALLVYQILLHRKHTMMYELMFQARAEEIEAHAEALIALEERIKELEEAHQGPRLVTNGKTA